MTLLVDMYSLLQTKYYVVNWKAPPWYSNEIYTYIE